MIVMKTELKTPINAESRALLQDIKLVIKRMEQRLLDVAYPTEIMRSDLMRIISSGGKRLRPILAYICYRIGGDETIPIMPLTCMLELMHTASLIHDDVVDNAGVRRSVQTINATSGTEAAVKSGDYLLAEAMTYLHNYKGTGINEALVQASSDMCIGELQQLLVRYDLKKQTLEQYFLQIYRKTASLIAASCYSGGIAGGLTNAKATMLREYGEKLGIAFQLCDDLLDFSGQPEFGKRAGQDLQNGIFTLPLLYLLEKGVSDDTKELMTKKNKDEDEFRRLLFFVGESEALEHTKKMICQHTMEAVDALRDIPECIEKTALIELAMQLSDRNT